MANSIRGIGYYRGNAREHQRTEYVESCLRGERVDGLARIPAYDNRRVGLTNFSVEPD